jgi:hypothetical protein
MTFRATIASIALALTAGAASAQGTNAEALQIAANQNACGSAATIQSAEFLPNGNVRVVCLRPAAGGDLGGSLGATGTAVAGLTFVAIIASLGGDGSSSTTTTTN